MFLWGVYMIIIGRKKEQDILTRLADSKRPEFLAIYGRRRVGKTYLIKEFFNNKFCFYATGVYKEKTKKQLNRFRNQLIEYGLQNVENLNSWFEAFNELKRLLEQSNIKYQGKKKIVFIDEASWLDSARSDFKESLDYFWNTYASTKEDVLLILCTSSTSWIIDNVLHDKGGLYNRVTEKIKLNPFSISETKKLFEYNGMNITNKDVFDYYMVFGGIPFYINKLDNKLSISQNIDELLFKEDGALRYEYNYLFSSLFKNYQNHLKIIEYIAKRKCGVSRKELVEGNIIQSGGALTTILNELEQCGFIRKYNVGSGNNNSQYQVIDHFALFANSFMINNKIDSWITYINTPSYYSWSGYSFEMLCLNHINEIKDALKIGGVLSKEYGFINNKKGGAQIDLVIDRADNVINLCEMKYSDSLFEITANYYEKLINKIDVFRNEIKNKKAIHLTMITLNGTKKNQYSNIVINDIKVVDFLV